MTNFSASLRLRTRDLHKQIETNPLHSSLVDGTMIRAGYRLLLERMYGFVKVFEAQAAPRPEWASWGFDFESRRKSYAIRRDLLVMGAAILEIENLPLAALDRDLAPFCADPGIPLCS